jgi:hypothetical protein
MTLNKDWTWQMVWALGIVAGAIVIMFWLSPTEALQERLIGLFEVLVGLIVGVGAGAVAYRLGWRVGLNSGLTSRDRSGDIQ